MNYDTLEEAASSFFSSTSSPSGLCPGQREAWAINPVVPSSHLDLGSMHPAYKQKSRI